MGICGAVGSHYKAEVVAPVPVTGSSATIWCTGLSTQLLDQHHWTSRAQLATAIFEWIECWYNPRRRHSYCDGLSPIDYETTNAA